jgi:hypothetical protein
MFGSLLRNIFLKSIKFSLRSNNVIFDVSDLKYEQALDLGIYKNRLNIIKEFEENFFTIAKVNFIFASNSMRDYAIKKYSINPLFASVLENGGNKLPITTFQNFKPDTKKINYIYAGTLNKGRNISNMINQFPETESFHLYLIGPSGDWINSNNLKKNVTYLGKYPNIEAQQLASYCDVGLIPYDQTLLYYNLAFPTKLSFYITAGLPFLSTPSQECVLISNNYKVGFIDVIQNWRTFINSITIDEINNQKKKIKEIKEDFYWGTIIKKSILNNYCK